MDTESMAAHEALIAPLLRRLDSPGLAMKLYIAAKDHVRVLENNGVYDPQLAGARDDLLALHALRDARVTLPRAKIARAKALHAARSRRHRARKRAERESQVA